VIEVVGLDRVHGLSRLAACRNQVVPAARRHLAAVVEARQRRAMGFDPWKSVQQPAVEALLAERALDGRGIDSGMV
jgi:hypothetical protein